MPWTVRGRMEERLRFVSRALAGESMTELCREFGIARKTGYKFVQRFAAVGVVGLDDASRRPTCCPHATPPALQQLIVRTKQDKPQWGASKLLHWLRKKHPRLPWPSRCTVHAILQRYELVTPRLATRRVHPRLTTPLASSTAPNQIWSADFKGPFRLGNGRRCHPVTISDHYSRFLIRCEALDAPTSTAVSPIFVAAFQEYGLPDALRSDNGVPFASTGLFGLSVLSVWWWRLGIQLQRIAPGHPEQNGRHERLHLTLKQATTRPAGANFLQQQEQFDRFRADYNHDRPHEALAMQCPAEVYQPAARPYPPTLPDPQYPLHDLMRTVHRNGDVRLSRRCRFHLTDALRTQQVGLREEDLGLWKVTFLEFDLGLFDADAHQFTPFHVPQRGGGPTETVTHVP